MIRETEPKMKIATLEKIHELLKAEAETPHFKRGAHREQSPGADDGGLERKSKR